MYIYPISERAEEIGETVGYQIRLEKRAEEAHTKLLFCTTGGWLGVGVCVGGLG
jgi:HrpA-like RNA helicase